MTSLLFSDSVFLNINSINSNYVKFDNFVIKNISNLLLIDNFDFEYT